MGILAGALQEGIGKAMPSLISILFMASALGSLLGSLAKPAWILGNETLRGVFVTSAPWLALRVLGGVLSTCVALQWGPEWIIGEDTGQVAFIELAGIIFCIMLVANFLLPLLTDFGFLDFIGTLLERLFYRVFRLPGRGGARRRNLLGGGFLRGSPSDHPSVRGGHYTAREAAAVVTNFSAVSLPFCVVIAELAGLMDHFLAFYLITLGCGLLCALITPRLPPLSRLSEYRYPGALKGAAAELDAMPDAVWPRAWFRAATAGAQGPGPRRIVRQASHTIFDIYMAVLPAAMTIEFLALVVITYTEWLTWLSLPMYPLLWLLQLPDAWAVLPGTLVGFFDQFIPAIIAADIADPVSRFVLASLSVTQLIFIAENGILILRSSIPLNLPQLAAVFFLRTVITLPVLALAGHVLF